MALPVHCAQARTAHMISAPHHWLLKAAIMQQTLTLCLDAEQAHMEPEALLHLPHDSMNTKYAKTLTMQPIAARPLWRPSSAMTSAPSSRLLTASSTQ